jgi:uroporphyrinogen-III synthase
LPLRRLLITRPRAEAEGFAAEMRALGIEPLIEPMFEIDLADARAPPLELAGVQALLLTSRNGAAALARATVRRDLPVFAVGDASASEARNLGFAKVESANGDAAALAALVIGRLAPNGGALLHVAGKAVAGDLIATLVAAGFSARRAILYEARAVTALTPDCRQALAAGGLDGAAFFSPRTAATFARLVQAAALQDRLAIMIAFCLSPAAASAATALSWRRIDIAERPNQAALMQCLRREVETP